MKTAIETKVLLIREGLFAVESESQTLVTYKVNTGRDGAYTCMGNSLGERCWPFYNSGTCKHIRRVQAFIAPAPVAPLVVAAVSRPTEWSYELEFEHPLRDIMNYEVPLTPTEARKARRYERVKEAW